MKVFKKLTSQDLAFGMGRKATSEEIQELLSRPAGKGKTIEKILADRKLQKSKEIILKAS